jgi:hypothetical protein
MWNSLYVGASNTFSAVCSVPSAFVSVAWGHKTTTPNEHLDHNLDDTWLIIQALLVVFAAVYSFRSNASKQKVPRAQQAVPSMYLISKRTEFLDFASTQIYFYFVFYIAKVYFTVPGLGWIIDQQPSNTFVVTAMRQFGSRWMDYYQLNVFFLLLRVCIMMIVFDNRIHSCLKMSFTHAAQKKFGDDYDQFMNQGDNIAKSVAFYTDSVKLVVVFFCAWPVIWCLKDTYIGLVFCGFFMVFYYEILTIVNLINAFYGSFDGLYIKLFQALMSLGGMARTARLASDRRRVQDEGRGFRQAAVVR